MFLSLSTGNEFSWECATFVFILRVHHRSVCSTFGAIFSSCSLPFWFNSIWSAKQTPQIQRTKKNDDQNIENKLNMERVKSAHNCNLKNLLKHQVWAEAQVRDGMASVCVCVSAYTHIIRERALPSALLSPLQWKESKYENGQSMFVLNTLA